MAYATFAQFIGPDAQGGYGGPATILGPLTQADVESELDAASATMDEHFAQWGLPLVSYPINFAQRCCHIAAYTLLSGPRGYNPSAGADPNIKARYDAAMEWLDKIQRRVLQPVVVETARAEFRVQPYVLSSSVVDVATGQHALNRRW